MLNIRVQVVIDSGAQAGERLPLADRLQGVRVARERGAGVERLFAVAGRYIHSMGRFVSTDMIGRELSGVTILEELGQGAMGVVYVGFQRSLKRKIAVKILPKNCIVEPSVKLRFRDESETVAVLAHPNIVPIFDMGENDEFLFQFMQLIEGCDLKGLIKTRLAHPVRRITPVEEAVPMFVQVLDALSYAHNSGVVHRDIKPSNILIEERSGRPYLADFGIAAAAECETIPSQTILGTPIYMAPEQFMTERADVRSDIYSAGLVLFELLAGTLPLRTNDLSKIIGIKINEPSAFLTVGPSEKNRLIDTRLEEIICKAIESDPEKRYQRCASFLSELSAYGSTLIRMVT